MRIEDTEKPGEAQKAVRHTPEPWRVVYDSPRHSRNRRIDCNGLDVATVYAGGTRPNDMIGVNNANRIVACVNACTGIENPEAALEDCRVTLAAIIDECDWEGKAIETRVAHIRSAAKDALSNLKGGKK